MITRPSKEHNEAPDLETCPEGEHVCTLKLKDCEVPKWGKNSDGEPVKLVQTRPGVRFVFKVEGKPWYLTKGVGVTTHERGGLFKWMQDCKDSLLREVDFNEKGFAADDDKFFEILDSLERQKYTVTCVHNVGEKITFANIAKVKPIAGSKVELPAGKIDTAPVPFEDDDIPF